MFHRLIYNATLTFSLFKIAKSGMMSRSEGRKEEKAWRLEGWHKQEGDEEINDELEAFVAAATTTSEVPSKLTTTLQFGYEDGMLASLEDMDEDGDIDGDDFSAYIQTVMTHVQSYYFHSESLGTEIEIQVRKDFLNSLNIMF